jgi:hypothetical protein
MTFKSKLLSSLVPFFMLLISGQSWALKSTESPGPLSLAVVAPVVDCATLASADISAAVGSTTHITSPSQCPKAGRLPIPR